MVIGGPTATGKTGLAIDLALALRATGRDAEVISADSRQVYRGLDVGTAKPSLEERRGIVHHGLDLVDPDEPFSVADFVRHADGALERIHAAGAVAILVGGTGMWLRAVAAGLDVDALPHDPELRARLEADVAGEGTAASAARLEALAPRLAAAVDLHNPRRIVRALEIATLVGDVPRPAPRGYGGPVIRFGLDLADRELHGRWIATRAEAQLDAGIVEEAAALRDRFGEHHRAFSAIGYREAWALADGRLDLAAYLAENVRRNVAFARRQRTWFRAERDITWIDAGHGRPIELTLAHVDELLDPAERGSEARH